MDVRTLLKNIGRQIATRRRRLGWTQQDLADAFDVGLKYIQFVEAGQRGLSLQAVVAFANVLGCEVIDLFRKPSAAKRVRPKTHT